MRWRAFWIALLVITGVGQAHARDLPDLIDFIRGGVVAIGTYMPSRSPRGVFTGTGFVVGDGTLVVTNAHVVPTTVDEARREHVAVFSGRGKLARMIVADVAARDPAHDLVVLRLREGRLPPLRLASGDELPREGTSVALTGFPVGMVLGLYPATHTGIVAAISPVVIPQANSRDLTPQVIRAMRDPYMVLQLDITAYPGNSGSPVYTVPEGRVIGVVNSVAIKATKESALTDPSGISYAIPVRYIHQLLREAR